MWLEGVKPYLRGERVLCQDKYTELARTIAAVVSYNGNYLRIDAGWDKMVWQQLLQEKRVAAKRILSD